MIPLTNEGTPMTALCPFHLAFPVDDLAAARDFYGNLLGCSEGRSSSEWIDFNFYGEFAIEIAEIKVIVALILLEGSHFDIAEANVPLPSIRIKRSHLISFKQRVPLISVLRRSAGPKTFSTDFSITFDILGS